MTKAELIAQNQGLAKRLGAMVAKYDVVAPSKRRRAAIIEREKEDRQLSVTDRLKAINITRDIERNYSSGKATQNQFKNNVVGVGPKIRVHSDDAEFAAAATTHFNSVWAKNADFRADLHFGEIVGLIETGLKREGDMLQVFDDGVIEDSGQMLFFEADQIVTPTDWENAGQWAQYKCEAGVVYDKWGRELAYVVHPEHGRGAAPFVECTVFPKLMAKMLRKTWRFNQLRGTPEMITAAADYQDLYELREKIKQTAKVVASMAGVVKKKDAAEELDLRRMMDDNSGAGTAPLTSGGAQPDAGATYERLGALLGGFLEYLEPDDDFQMLDMDRPKLEFCDVMDRFLRGAGASQGLSKTYTTLTTDSSYTAFRGDMLLSWTQFRIDQKWLERHCTDWVAAKVITRAIRKKEINQNTAPYTFSWNWPEMPAVDPLKDAQADVLRLSHLLTDYSEIMGPDWEKTFAAIAEQAKVAKETHFLPVRIFESEKESVRFTNAGNNNEGATE